MPPRISADSTRRRGRNCARCRATTSIFADAIKASRVVLGESGGRDVHSDLDKELPVTGFAMLGEDPDPFMFKFGGLLRNVKVLEEAAAGRGLFTIVPERDGIVRRVPMIMDAQNVRMPALSFEILRILGGSGTIMIKADQVRHRQRHPAGTAAEDSDRQLGPLLDSLCPQRSLDLRLGGRRARRPGAAGQDREKAGPDRHLRHRHERHQDHAGVARDARRRDPCPGAGKCADRLVAVAADAKPRSTNFSPRWSRACW